jgi:long-chain acyl-CoA synthetase
VAVIGVPDEKFGEEVVAYVVLRDPSANKSMVSESLDKYAREKMSNYKVPRVYKFIDEMPRNAMGKILRASLKEEFAKDN